MPTLYPMPKECPVCHHDLVAERLRCPECATALEGAFLPGASPFQRLTAEQQQFVLTFVRCEGRLNRMEEELKISYPTIRNRLGEVIRALGYEPSREEAPTAVTRPGPEARRQVLTDLQEGKITAEEARQLLSGQARSQPPQETTA